MKKCISVILLLTIISSKTEVHELFKLPLLLHHYFEHKSSDNNISFTAFLKMHYSENGHEGKDQRHDNLPFKSHCHTLYAFTTDIFTTPHFDFNFQPRSGIKTMAIYRESYLGSGAGNSIWQPPRAC